MVLLNSARHITFSVQEESQSLWGKSVKELFAGLRFGSPQSLSREGSVPVVTAALPCIKPTCENI